MFDLLIASRTELHESRIAAKSRLLIVIRSENIVLRYFGVLHTMYLGH